MQTDVTCTTLQIHQKCRKRRIHQSAHIYVENIANSLRFSFYFLACFALAGLALGVAEGDDGVSAGAGVVAEAVMISAMLPVDCFLVALSFLLIIGLTFSGTVTAVAGETCHSMKSSTHCIKGYPTLISIECVPNVVTGVGRLILSVGMDTKS